MALDWSRVRFFQPEEFACRCGCGANLIDLELVHKLDTLRERFGRALLVTSGYRCPARNLAVAESGADGPHTTGKAVDLKVPNGMDAFRIVEASITLGFTGIGIDQKPGGRRIVHLDIVTGPNRPAIFTY